MSRTMMVDSLLELANLILEHIPENARPERIREILEENSMDTEVECVYNYLVELALGYMDWTYGGVDA